MHTDNPVTDSFVHRLLRWLAWLTREMNNRYLALEAEGLKRRSEQTTHAPA